MVKKTQVSSFQIGRGYVYGECSDKIIDGDGNCWDFNFELMNFHDRKSEKISDDIIDRLPSDPFGMDISATFNAITSLIEEIEKDFNNIDGVGNFWDFNFELMNFHDRISERISDDIVDMLPSDPFGMDISATFNAFTSWIEEFEKDFELSALGFVIDKTDGKNGDDRIHAELNLLVNGAMMFYPEVSGVHNDDPYGISINSVNECEGGTKDSCNGGAPHDALFFALSHLGLQDLLSVERVCKSLRNAVQNDPLLWRNIRVTWPLSDKMSDDILFRLADRAQGSLQCLSVVRSRKITDSGIKRVLESNVRLVKLAVPGCSRLSIGGIVNNLKICKVAGSPILKNLRIGGIYDLRIGGIYEPTNKHFEDLMFLLDRDNNKSLSAGKPWFYRGAQPYLSIDDDRAVDIEPCPRCKVVKQVYDCPADSCQLKNRSLCRACLYCVPRCYICGRCFTNCDFVESFNMDSVCMWCWKQFDCDDDGKTIILYSQFEITGFSYN